MACLFVWEKQVWPHEIQFPSVCKASSVAPSMPVTVFSLPPSPPPRLSAWSLSSLQLDAQWWHFLDFILHFFLQISESTSEASGSLSKVLLPCLWTQGRVLFFPLSERGWWGRGSGIVPSSIVAFHSESSLANSASVSALQNTVPDSHFLNKDSRAGRPEEMSLRFLNGMLLDQPSIITWWWLTTCCQYCIQCIFAERSLAISSIMISNMSNENNWTEKKMYLVHHWW